MFIRHWHSVVETIAKVYQVQLPCTPLECILESLDKEIYLLETRVLISGLLFLVRKLLALKWTFPYPSTLEEWQTQVNSTLLKEHTIYQSRGAPHEFMIWGPWLSVQWLVLLSVTVHPLLQS